MYWTLELASKLEDAPWPATKDELIDYAIRSGAPLEVVENLKEIEDEDEIYECMEDLWPDYPSKEDFFFQELIPQAEQRYRAGGSKGQRAVMGLSMGGGGSTVYGQRHSDKFSAVYAMSAWLDSDGGHRREEGVDDKVYLVNKAVHDYSALDFLRNADEQTLQRLRTVKWFFDCGDDDFLFDLNIEIHQLMRQRRVKGELRIRNGQHNWEYWHQAIRIALPFASRNFDR